MRKIILKESALKQRNRPLISQQYFRCKEGVPMDGEPLELRDELDEFVAFGVYRKARKGAFQALSSHESDDIESSEFWMSQWLRCAKQRKEKGFVETSFRWIYSEGDHLSGLISDRFLGVDGTQVVILQLTSQALERLKVSIEEGLSLALEQLSKNEGWPELSRTQIINRENSKWRELSKEKALPQSEALPGPLSIENLRIFQFWVGKNKSRIRLSANLFDGQKTGFFFDQLENIESLKGLLSDLKRASNPEVTEGLRVLDLFCYVGHWGAQVSKELILQGREVSVSLVDASEPALSLAKSNVLDQGAQAEVIQMNIVKDLGETQLEAFDIVICDPPAFIQKKEDLRQGSGAYTKVNREALRRVKPGGLFVSCSCSGHLKEDDFQEVVQAGAKKAGREIIWLSKGAQALDHPVSDQFSEGHYLKCLIGRVL